MFRQIGLCSSDGKKISWWWLGVKVGVVVALVIWWWLENQDKKLPQESASQEPDDQTQAIPLPVDDDMAVKMPDSIDAAVPAEPDDLTRIEGIGPKINAALQGAGIRTFAGLAASKPQVLKQILVDAGIRIGYPDTWPEQAALAAKADWTALEELQNGLHGGRRVG